MHERLARWLDSRLVAGMSTLETGCGLSTLIFVLKRTQHTCICPDASLLASVKAWCDQHAVSSDNLRMVADVSEHALPMMEPMPLDLVLIDGGHGFPVPFIDWHFTAGRLKVGGLMVVDDVQLWTGAVLRDFLKAEPGWELAERFLGRSVAFVKTATGDHAKEWDTQPFTARRSHLTMLASNLITVRELLAMRDWTGLRKGIISELRRRRLRRSHLTDHG
jgi:Methyltransferase domain